MADRMSTQEDIKKLMAVCESAPGTVCTWESLEEVLGLARTDRRFRTIYRAWIRYLRKWQNRKMVVVPGVGLRILHERERAGDVCATLDRTTVFFERAKMDVDDIQIVELSGPEVEEAHHVRHITHRLQRAMQEERTRLATRPGMPVPSPAPSRPTLVAG